MKEGIFIPDEFLENNELNHTEMIVLSIYKYYTENGKYKCCSLTCSQIADKLNVSIWYLNKIKKHLKELGYISTDGGIKVTYLGITDCTIVQNEDCTIVQSESVPEYRGSVPEYREDCTIVQSESVPEYNHNKEKEEKKEIKKDGITNFDLLLGKLSKDYLTPEKIEYMKEHFMNRINEVDIEDGVIDSWITNIKNELNKQYPIEFVIEKKEPVSKAFDITDFL